MATSRNLTSAMLAILATGLLIAVPSALGQVNPAEIVNPRLKALEEANLGKLKDLNARISELSFPFSFALHRYVGLDPGNWQDADSRGIEFVKFHDYTVLKISGNYSAAFNADLLTSNERADHVLNDVVVPILSLLPNYLPKNPPFDAFGFEISYHVRTHNRQFGYEGKENLAMVFNKADVSAFLAAKRQSTRQEVIDHSLVYLDGKEFGLALGEKKPFDVETLDKSQRARPVAATEAARRPESDASGTPQAAAEPKISAPSSFPGHTATASAALEASRAELELPGKDAQHGLAIANPIKDATVSASPAAPPTANGPSPLDLDAVQKKYQSRLDQLTKDGLAQYHFVSYAPASLGLFHNRIYLQITLRNSEPFDRSTTSIYKRAAQSFDLFLAPQLKGLLGKISLDQEIAGVDITVLDQFSRAASASSEALEFICPIGPLRHFADADITNQDLIQQSVVLVNGVRIALNLQQVE